MPLGGSSASFTPTRLPSQLSLFSLPNEITGSGMLAKRGWKWWVSRRILWALFVLLRGRRYGRLVFETVRGIPIIVFPGVFHPTLFLSTLLLLDAIDEFKLESRPFVLDLGTGTGICAIYTAVRGARVTATDINPVAVRCARVNALINNLEDRVRVLEGDLFQPVKDDRFDLVMFNPPYYEGKPRDWADHAWRGEDVIDRFVEGLSAHLTPGGKVLLAVSTELDLSAIKKKLQECGFETRELRKRRILGETIAVYQCGLSG